ncbi:hypothetical protein [Flindersiella endophytica]
MPSTPPSEASSSRCRRPAARNVRHGRRHAPKTTAAPAIRSHATPAAGICPNSSTANAGPR